MATGKTQNQTSFPNRSTNGVMKKTPSSSQKKLAVAAVRPGGLLADVRELILVAREGVARAVDSGLVTLYWHVGRRIRQDILKEKRAEYGKQIFYALSRKLTAEFGRGYSERNLANMVRFAEVFPVPIRRFCTHCVQNWAGRIFGRSSTSTTR
jgi:hypothetical protein